MAVAVKTKVTVGDEVNVRLAVGDAAAEGVRVNVGVEVPVGADVAVEIGVFVAAGGGVSGEEGDEFFLQAIGAKAKTSNSVNGKVLFTECPLGDVWTRGIGSGL